MICYREKKLCCPAYTYMRTDLYTCVRELIVHFVAKVILVTGRGSQWRIAIGGRESTRSTQRVLFADMVTRSFVPRPRGHDSAISGSRPGTQGTKSERSRRF